MALVTNLIPVPDGKIQDVRSSLLDQLREFLFPKINDKQNIQIILLRLDRKLIKNTLHALTLW